MKITRLLVIALLPSLWLSAQAQEESATGPSSQEEVYSPLKGKYSLAATLSYNNYLSAPVPARGLESYEAEALSANWSDKKLQVGIDANWFFSNKWKLNLSAGFNFSKNPGYSEKVGVRSNGNVLVPAYGTVAKQHSIAGILSLGADRYFHAKSNPNFVWYVGPHIGLAYVQNAKDYDEVSATGTSKTEAWNARVAATVGADYYFANTFFVGIQVDPLAYTYGVNTIKPQPNLGKRSADAHSFSFLAAPTLKVGFAF